MNASLVDAINENRLYETALTIVGDSSTAPADRERAERAIAACEQIGRVCLEWRRELVERLRDAGCEVGDDVTIGPRQRHTIDLAVADYDTARRAVSLLDSDGFEPWQTWARGAERSARRFATELVVGATSDATIVVRLRWGGSPSRSRLRRALTPTAGDWGAIELPTALWPAYPLVRLGRLILMRIGLGGRLDDSLGPFLSTPDELVQPLLEFGEIRPSDRVVDIGCGDGRVVVAAAAHSACRAVGVERSVELVERARRRAVEHGVAELVDIVSGDGRTVGVDDATLVFLFLPVRVVGELVPVLLERLESGARIVVHEQSPLPDSMQPPPDESVALITGGAVTVAHRWTAR